MGTQNTTNRLGSGKLRERVLEGLRATGEAVGPSVLAKTLGSSSGAVSNALERLVVQELAKKVSEKPKRYEAVA